MTFRWFILLLFLPINVMAKTYQINCPDQIIVDERATRTPEGWRTVKSSFSHFWNSVGMSVDEPEKMVTLKPDTITATHSTWLFNAKDHISLICGYQETSIQLTKFLPQQTMDCTVWYKKFEGGDRGPIPDHLLCHQQNG